MLATIRDAVLGKPPPTLREIKRENKRMARRAARDIDRQMVDIERRENDLMKSHNWIGLKNPSPDES